MVADSGGGVGVQGVDAEAEDAATSSATTLGVPEERQRALLESRGRDRPARDEREARQADVRRSEPLRVGRRGDPGKVAENRTGATLIDENRGGGLIERLLRARVRERGESPRSDGDGDEELVSAEYGDVLPKAVPLFRGQLGLPTFGCSSGTPDAAPRRQGSLPLPAI